MVGERQWRPRVLAALITLALVPAGCGGGERRGTGEEPGARPAVHLAPGEGRRRVAERLRYLADNVDPVKNRFANTARIQYLQAAIAQVTLPRQRMSLQSNLADEFLKAGRLEEAFAQAEALLKARLDGDPEAPPVIETRRFLAVASLRQGTRENCVAAHNPERCQFPIRGRGLHTVKRGSRRAIVELMKVLEERPDDLEARWLLNLAAMTLDEYPQGVPRRWLIAPAAFAPEYDIGRFDDVSIEAGLSVPGLAGGCLVEDFDGDGLLDVMLSSMGLRAPLHLFLSNGDGTFTERPAGEAGIDGLVGGLNLLHADYDNDGDVDVLVLRGGWMQKGGDFPPSLLRNEGGGRFEDVTESAGILTELPRQNGGFADYDGDGDLDLFLGNESQPDDPHPCELYRNNGDGTFTNRAVDLGDPDMGYVKGSIWGDYNNDGRPDLYVSALGGRNRLLRNDGPRAERGPAGEEWRFTDVAQEAGVVGPDDSFAVWFFDYDNDGWLDLFVLGFRITDSGDAVSLALGLPHRTEVPRLYHNNGDGTFRDVSHEARVDRIMLAMGANFGDLDNDGWTDLYVGTGEPSFRGLVPNVLLRNDGGRVFQDVTASARVGHLQKGHALAFGDLDNDGDQDIVEEMGGWFEDDMARTVLYRNPGHGRHWVTLRLEGRRSNRSAIGARLRLTITENGRPRDIYAAVNAGGSFGGNSLQQEIGLGAARVIDRLEVRWPASGTLQEFTAVPADAIYALVEGEQALRPVEVKRFPLGAGQPRPPNHTPRRSEEHQGRGDRSGHLAD